LPTKTKPKLIPVVSVAAIYGIARRAAIPYTVHRGSPMQNAVRVNEGFQEKRRYAYVDYLEWEGPERYLSRRGLYDGFAIGGASGASDGTGTESSV